MSSFESLMRNVRRFFPDAEVGEDNDGQVVIYTGLQEGSDGQLVPLTEEVSDVRHGEG